MNGLARGNRLYFLALFAAWGSLGVLSGGTRAGDPDPMEIFNQRILPIFKSEKPSSCVQCHLSSVDLRDYILPSAEKTFVSLRDQGLIDLDAPEKSKILKLIRMGDKDADEGARLIHAKMRQAEYEAFAAWIAACAKDERMRNLPALSAGERAGPDVADAVIRHARKSRVVDSFARTIWAQRLRCFPCHTPFEVDPDNPRQRPAQKTLRQLTERYGKEKVEQLGFIRDTPEATLQRLIEVSRKTPRGELPLINIHDPLNSLLLLKPLAKLPPKNADGRIGEASNRIPVSHGGGLKMHKNDPSYKAFASWLIDYAKTVQGEYRSVDELPHDNWISTEYVIRVTEMPEKWKPGTTVQLMLHPWDEEKAAFSQDPIAFTQSVITPRHIVNGTLFMFRFRGNQPAVKSTTSVPALRGKFLVKVYIDGKGKLDRDPSLLLGNDELVGRLEMNVRRWRPGFKNARKVSGESLTVALAPREKRPPNIVLIFTDDQGYSDVGVFGAKGFRTPHLDKMAAEGTRFTSFYVAQAVCTASRAALMSGCYANRVSMSGALNHTSRNGIHPDELLLPEICKARGYATACFGKWHLGTLVEFGPLRHGFDEFLGIPYSNDNSKYHPVIRDMPPLPLYDGKQVIELDPDQSQFTRRFTERAVAFIEKNWDRPFFLYVPHVMPHVPIFASEAFQGHSELGLYGDVIQEIDWSVGQILSAIRRCGLDDNTLVIFTSDNGPFLSYGEHAGSARPWREGKLTTFEGGHRTPCIVRWPGHVPAGRVCDEMISTIDLLPTIARLIDGPMPTRKIDGLDMSNLLLGKPDARSPRKTFYFYAGRELQAVRAGKWKLHFPHQYLTVAGPPGRGGKPSNWGKLKPKDIRQSGIYGIASRHGYRVEKIGLSLFDLSADPSERHNVASQHPEIVEQLKQLAEQARADLGDSLTGRTGTGVRPCAVRDEG